MNLIYITTFGFYFLHSFCSFYIIYPPVTSLTTQSLSENLLTYVDNFYLNNGYIVLVVLPSSAV